LSVADIDLYEINEAFASVVLATQKDLNIPMEKINVNGGAIALGHPLGCSGARILTTLVNELERRNLKRGLVSMCVGFGPGIATVVELV
jgi:acetyl-CoA acetyltransferase